MNSNERVTPHRSLQAWNVGCSAELKGSQGHSRCIAVASKPVSSCPENPVELFMVSPGQFDEEHLQMCGEVGVHPLIP